MFFIVFWIMKLLLIFVDDDWVYGFFWVIVGDEFSKWIKFVLIVWFGKNVFGIKWVRMGIDKFLVKEVICVCSFIV